MYAADNPKEMTFSRNAYGGVSDVKAMWQNVLKGKARIEHFGNELFDIMKLLQARVKPQPKLGIVKGALKGRDARDKADRSTKK